MAEVDLALQKLPPQNIEAEQAVLGAVLLDNAVLPQVIEVVQPQDFYRSGHRRIFEAMLDLFETGKPNVPRKESLLIRRILDVAEQKRARQGFVRV